MTSSSTVAGATSQVIIRGYQRSDRAAIREICRQAASEQPDPLFHEDRELAPMLLADYYLEYEPESCFVAEVDRRVVGYMVGCKDTLRYLRVRKRRVFPRVILRILSQTIILRYRRKATFRTLWWRLVNHIRPNRQAKPIFQLSEYPAHSHFNVAPDFRGGGIGSQLSVAYHDFLRAQGVKGLHAVSVEKVGADHFSNYLCDKRGYELVAVRKHPLLGRVTGQEYFLKFFICDLEREAREAEAARIGRPEIA